MHKAGFVNIVGNPNVGKSTLMNALVGERISIATFKAQTTRHRIMGIYNTDDMQIVFSDTPGVLKPTYKLQESMLNFSTSALTDADVLLYVTDVVETPDKHNDFVEKVSHMEVPVLLLVNKIDLSNQEKLVELVEAWKELLPNAEIIPISAATKFNVDYVMKRIKELLPDSPPYFDKDQWTDKPARFFVNEIIREKILLYYDKEIPYSVEVVVEQFKEEEKKIHINAVIYVERDSQKGIIIGKQGKALKKVATEARRDLERFFGKTIFLETFVKVDKDWRSSDKELRNFGDSRKKTKNVPMGNLVAIVGRPNVGKSTLFNRLTKTRQAIVNEEAGTTRDRQYGKSEWLGREFSVVDTGGWVVNSDDIFEEEIRKQVLMAVDEADVILFVVDVMNGVTDLDLQVASILRRAKKPVLLVANKTDNNELQYNAPEFYSLGLGDPYCISAVTGSGTGDLMDLIVENFKKESDEILDEDIPRFAVVGRPNAGKSSIVNAFIGEDRNIVTEIAGTTRDSIYTRYNKFGFDFYLVDTAGIRKKNKVNEDLEYYSVIRSIRSIENSDVCILMLDATRGIESQDLNIFSLIQKNSKGLVVVVNKWDLVEDKTVKVMKTFENAIRSRFAPFVDFPIIFASALTKQRILKVLEEARTVYENRMIRIPTARLNEEMLPLIEAYPPPAIKGKYIKIKYITQLPNTQIPSFVYFANLPQYVKEPYKRFLENKMREKWNLTGTPINIYIRQK